MGKKRYFCIVLIDDDHKMLITVILPVYNVEAYLCTCLDSLLQQSFRDYEILLIDDGSEDSSGRICDEYARRYDRIRTVHKANGGPGSARNLGLELAQGEYIVFCDPDDWVDPDFLQQFLDAGMNHTTMPFTGILQHREGKPDRALRAPVMEVSGADCPQAIAALRRCDMLGFAVNKLLVKQIIDKHKIRFIDDLRYREDEMFMLEYVRHVSRIAVNGKTPYHYRILGGGLSKKRKPTELILRVSHQLHDLFLQAVPTPEGRYVAARIHLQQCCEAVAASKNASELRLAAGALRQARREYLSAFDPAFLTDRRDRKVADRSRWVLAAGAVSDRLLRRLTRLIHI